MNSAVIRDTKPRKRFGQGKTEELDQAHPLFNNPS